MLNTILESLKGRKTYVMAGLTIVYCLLGIFLHFMTIPAALAFIGSAGSIAALRGGVGKVESILNVVFEALQIVEGSTTPTTPPAPTA